MLPESRRRRLLDLVLAAGSANVDELAAQPEVSQATIRRDLGMLARAGQVVRAHGGALVPHASTSFEPLYQQKREANAEAKAQIARCAAQRVQDGDVVVLDSGSTMLALPTELRERSDLTMIPSDLKIALELGNSPHLEVILTGGRVRQHLFSFDRNACRDGPEATPRRRRLARRRCHRSRSRCDQRQPGGGGGEASDHRLVSAIHAARGPHHVRPRQPSDGLPTHDRRRDRERWRSRPGNARSVSTGGCAPHRRRRGGRMISLQSRTPCPTPPCSPTPASVSTTSLTVSLSPMAPAWVRA
jgi:hypothetical protein